MRKTLGILLFLMFTSYLISYYLPDLPYITLPKGAQHNTLGELPIVEVIDDGDYNEVDGEEEPQFCDEIAWFTCTLKFGHSYAVSQRIALGELLSCEEARKIQQSNLQSCVQWCDKIKVLPDSANFHHDFYKDCITECNDRHQYLPECNGSYGDWLLEAGKNERKIYDAWIKYLRKDKK